MTHKKDETQKVTAFKKCNNDVLRKWLSEQWKPKNNIIIKYGVTREVNPNLEKLGTKISNDFKIGAFAMS